MAHLFSAAVRTPFWSREHFLVTAQNRFYTWLKLWLDLVSVEKQLGLPIPDDATGQMKANLVRLTLMFQSSPMC